MSGEPPTFGAARPKRGRGRPPRLTKALQGKIVSAVRAGALPVEAAIAFGVPRRTFYEWLQRGKGIHPSRPETPLYRGFVEAVDQALAESKLAARVELRRTNPRAWLVLADRAEGQLETSTSSDGAGTVGEQLAELLLLHGENEARATWVPCEDIECLEEHERRIVDGRSARHHKVLPRD
jgi:hypothetical protein